MNREERIKRALQAVILHWPTDLNDVSIRAYDDDYTFMGAVTYVQLQWREGAEDHYGVRIPFTPSELELLLTGPVIRDTVLASARTYAKRA